jgi:hypothetical protein
MVVALIHLLSPICILIVKKGGEREREEKRIVAAVCPVVHCDLRVSMKEGCSVLVLCCMCTLLAHVCVIYYDVQG